MILGYYYNKQIMVKDTAFTDSKGNCTFKGDSLLDQGLYVVYLPDQTYFDLLIGKEQNFKLSTKPKDFLDHIKITGSEESKAFIDYQRFFIAKQKEARITSYNVCYTKLLRGFFFVVQTCCWKTYLHNSKI